MALHKQINPKETLINPKETLINKIECTRLVSDVKIFLNIKGESPSARVYHNNAEVILFIPTLKLKVYGIFP